MDISYDYRDLFKLLNRHKARYLVVGAYAVMFYSEPRFTKDIDIWVDPEGRNARKVYTALKEFGAPLKGVKPVDFTNRKLFYQLGVAPVRIDIIMGLAGINFDYAWKKRKKTKYAGVSVNIIGKSELKASKKAVKRPQDLLDLRKLNNK